MIDPINALISLGILVSLVCLFYGPWQATCTDFARQLIFEQRDRLFDLGRSGKLDFNSETYKELRSTLEGFIRFAHNLTWTKLIFCRYFAKKATEFENKSRRSPSRYIKQIEDLKTREEAQNILLESTFTLILMMIFKSIILIPVALFLVIVFLFSHTIPLIIPKRLLKSVTETIEVGAKHAKA